MNITFAWALGGTEMILILAVILILFGAKKIPELARGMGQGIKEFKKATKEVTDEIQNAPTDTASTTPPPPAPSRATQTVSQSSDSPKV